MVATRSPRRIASFSKPKGDEISAVIEVEKAFLLGDYRKALLLANKALPHEQLPPRNLEQERLVSLDETQIFYKNMSVTVSNRRDSSLDRIGAVALQSWVELLLKVPLNQKDRAQAHILPFLDAFHRNTMSSSLFAVLIHSLVASQRCEQACWIATDFVRQLQGDRSIQMQLEEVEDILFLKMLPRYCGSISLLHDFLECLARNDSMQHFPRLQHFDEQPMQSSIYTILEHLPNLSLVQSIAIQSGFQELLKDAPLSTTDAIIPNPSRGQPGGSVGSRYSSVIRLLLLSKNILKRCVRTWVQERVVHPLLHGDRRYENRVTVGVSILSLWLGRRLCRRLAKHVLTIIREILDALILTSSVAH